MTHIDSEVNKGIGQKNQADAMVLIKHDFSKLEKDIEEVKGDIKFLKEAILSLINNSVLYNKESIEIQREQLELDKIVINRKLDVVKGSEAYLILKDELESMQKTHINTAEICACCGVCKPTALKLMRMIIHEEPNKYLFRICRGHSPAILLKKRQVNTGKINLLTAGAVTIGRDSDIKKRDLALCRRGSLRKKS